MREVRRICKRMAAGSGTALERTDRGEFLIRAIEKAGTSARQIDRREQKREAQSVYM